MNEQKKYEVIKNLLDSDGNKNRAAFLLGCSRRTIDRLINSYRLNGKAAFSHGNKGRSPSFALSHAQKKAIVLLYVNKYFDCNISHFTELLARDENIHISQTTARSILLAADILSPKAHKRTKKAFVKRLQEKKQAACSKKEKDSLSHAILALQDAHPRRPRSKYFGEMIQMDASFHLWFGEEKTYLHAAIDDATGTVVAAYFDKQETLNGYYNLFHQILTNYGIPYMFYTDRRTVFEYKKKNSPHLEENTFTQFAYACKQLGVALKTTSVAQAKGRVERLFGTLQSRLLVEMRLEGITTIEQANEFLNPYLKEFNAQFALPIDFTKSVFDKQPEDEKINLFLSVLTGRKVDHGHCIHFENKLYKLLDENGIHSPFVKGTDVLVAKTFNGSLFASVYDRIYALVEVPKHEEVSRNFSTDAEFAESKKPKKQYIPPMNHPWRKDNFMKYVRMMEGREEFWAC